MSLTNIAENASGLKVINRMQYNSPTDLSPSTVNPNDPLAQFRQWFKEANTEAESNALPRVNEPEAMSLSTVSSSGIPSARIVLLKAVDDRGFLFYTNYTSRKSRELEETGKAALAFYWREQHRQVRVVGRAEKVTRQESEEYFSSRPIGSRLGAWASRQSSVVQDGEVQERYNTLEERFGVNKDSSTAKVPLPDFWGGWRIVPDEVEFWAGKPSRLHDRVRYARDGESWKIERLAP